MTQTTGPADDAGTMPSSATNAPVLAAPSDAAGLDVGSAGRVMHNQTVRGDVLAAVGEPLPTSWLGCDLRETVWPDGVNGLSFVECDLTGSQWFGDASDLKFVRCDLSHSVWHDNDNGNGN